MYLLSKSRTEGNLFILLKPSWHIATLRLISVPWIFYSDLFSPTKSFQLPFHINNDSYEYKLQNYWLQLPSQNSFIQTFLTWPKTNLSLVIFLGVQLCCWFQCGRLQLKKRLLDLLEKIFLFYGVSTCYGKGIFRRSTHLSDILVYPSSVESCISKDFSKQVNK